MSTDMTAERKRVLFLSISFMGGGAERVFSTLLRHLDRTRFEPHLGLLHLQGPYLAELPGDVPVYDLRVSRLRYAMPAIVGLVRKLNPHTVLSTIQSLNLQVMLSKPFFPSKTRVLIREAAISTETLEGQLAHPQIWQWLYRRFYKRADRVICLSDTMQRDLVENFNVPIEKTVRIYNPVDAERIRELAALGGSPYSGAGPNVVAAGRLSAEKGFDLLLAAFSKVIKQFPQAELTILGDGPLKHDLMKQVQDHELGGNVRFRGFESNPWRYFKHADLFVLPSRYEGLPNVVLEALALAKPIVATDCPGGIKEIQTSDPEMILVPVGDSVALADAICMACSKPGRTKGPPDLSKFNLHHALDEYSQLF